MVPRVAEEAHGCTHLQSGMRWPPGVSDCMFADQWGEWVGMIDA